MDCFIWANKIVVPVKHGTRYCASIFQEYFSETQEPIQIGSEIWNQVSSKGTLEYIILRRPKDLLFSAVNTEIISCLNNINGDFVSKPTFHELKTCFENLLSSILNGYRVSHYDKDFYKIVHELSTSSIHIKMVDLESMTDFCKMITQVNNLPENDIAKFDFSESDYFLSKKLIWKLIENEFEKQFKDLMIIIDEQEKIYNKLNFINF